jgi:hypothetical protein
MLKRFGALSLVPLSAVVLLLPTLPVNAGKSSQNYDGLVSVGTCQNQPFLLLTNFKYFLYPVSREFPGLNLTDIKVSFDGDVKTDIQSFFWPNGAVGNTIRRFPGGFTKVATLSGFAVGYERYIRGDGKKAVLSKNYTIPALPVNCDDSPQCIPSGTASAAQPADPKTAGATAAATPSPSPCPTPTPSPSPSPSPGVDLTVQASTSTVDASWGQNIQVNWTVKNQGTQTASTNWVDGIYLSKDDVLDSSDTLLGTLSAASNIPLAAGASYRTHLTSYGLEL